MEIHFSNIVKRRSDGAMITIRLEIAKDIRSALRFNHVVDYQTFINGVHGPDDPLDYYLQAIRIMYEEVNEDE